MHHARVQIAGTDLSHECPGEFVINVNSINNVFSMIKPAIQLLSYCRLNDISYIHARNESMVLLSVIVRILSMFTNRTINLVLDYRGDMKAEYFYRNKSFFKRTIKAFSIYLNRVITRLFVSRAIAVNSELVKRSPISKRTKMFYGFVDKDNFFYSQEFRNNKRAEFGIAEDELIYIYSGSDKRYQLIDEIIRQFSKYDGPIERMRLVVLCPNSEAVCVRNKEYIDGLGDKVIFSSASYEDLPRWLSMADFGIMVRENADINRFAFPTKFFEYIFCGLPVLVSSITKDISDLTSQFSLGRVVDVDEMFDIEISMVSNIDRHEIENNARVIFNEPRRKNIIRWLYDV